MLNSKSEEDSFLVSILTQLKLYPDHNNDELDYVLQIIKYRQHQLEKSIIAKSKQEII